MDIRVSAFVHPIVVVVCCVIVLTCCLGCNSGSTTGQPVISSTSPESESTLTESYRSVWEPPQDPALPPADNYLNPPTHRMLMDAMAERKLMLDLESPGHFGELMTGQANGRNVSWDYFPPDGDRPFTEPGEYDFGPPGVVPPFGCNANPNNSSQAGNAIEDVLAEVSSAFYPHGYVGRGPLQPNYFNGRNYQDRWESIVGQTYSNTPPGELPTDWEYYSYYAGTTGIGPGGTCFNYLNYPVTGTAWRVLYRSFDCTPGRNTLSVFEFMVTPTGEMGPEYTSSGLTTGSFQPFLFGTIEPCYGSAIIFTAISTDSPCEYFRDYMPTDFYFQEFFSNPVFGLHLLRWQDMTRPDQEGPWETEFGWPVFGPYAFAGGSPVMINKGPCYIWCMWYERGFMYWLDFDNDGPLAPYPETTDEAVAFRFTGENIYCRDGGTFVPMQKMFYGDGGPLLTNVEPLGWRVVGEPDWREMDFQRSYYDLPIDQSGNLTVEIQLFARGFGGDPDEEFRYRHYEWDFGNGDTQPDGAPYEQTQQYATASYYLSAATPEAEYRVTVQVTDELTTGSNQSFPLRLHRLP